MRNIRRFISEKYTHRAIALMLALLFIAASAVGGTMAWQSMSQQALNVATATQPWQYGEPSDGDLTVEKVVVNYDGTPLTEQQQNQQFRFTVLFYDEVDENDSPIPVAGDFDFYIYPYEGEYPVIQTASNPVTFYLRHGELAIFTELPGGLRYLVTEVVPEDFDVSSEGHMGVIGVGTNHAVFTNTYNPAEPPPTDTSFIVRKLLTGDVPEDRRGDDFYFVVAIPAFGGYPNREWRINIQAGNHADIDGDPVWIEGETQWTFENLPIGALVLVREVNMPDGFVLYNVQNGFVSLTEETIVSYFTNRFVERDCCDCDHDCDPCDCDHNCEPCDCDCDHNCDCEPGGCDCEPSGGCDCEPCTCTPCNCEPCDCDCQPGGCCDCDCEPGNCTCEHCDCDCNCEPCTCDPCACEPCDCPIIVPMPSVAINKTANPLLVVAGDTVIYTLHVTNIGTVPLTDLVVTDILPNGMVNPHNLILPTAATGGFTGNVLRVELATLAPTVSMTITFMATVAEGTEPGSITNTARVESDEHDLSEEDSAMVTVTEIPVFSPYHNAFIIGRPTGNVYPSDNIIRAEVVTIFFRLLSDEFRTEMWRQDNPFSDVGLNQWYNNAISTMTNAGIVQGLPNGTFAPRQAITRAEVAAIVARFFDENYNGPLRFTDIAGHWAEEYINRLASYGWVVGSGDGTFRPNQLMTRAEVAALVNRMLNRVPGSLESLLPGRIHWPDKTNTNAWYYLYMQEATHSTEHERLPNGYVRWTEILPHLRWYLLERPNSRPNDIRVSRNRGLVVGQAQTEYYQVDSVEYNQENSQENSVEHYQADSTEYYQADSTEYSQENSTEYYQTEEDSMEYYQGNSESYQP